MLLGLGFAEFNRQLGESQLGLLISVRRTTPIRKVHDIFRKKTRYLQNISSTGLSEHIDNYTFRIKQ